MIMKGLLQLLTLYSALALIAARSSHDNDSMAVIHRALSVRFPRSYKCPRGTIVASGCSQNEGCCPCEEGKEYMDHPNSSTKCLRCSLCDTEHGFEVEKNCTSDQNVKCRCKPGFYCSSEPCHHCNPCDICENGMIVEECTQTTDTKCKRHLNLLWLLILVIPMGVVVVVAVKKKCWARNWKLNNLIRADDRQKRMGMDRLTYPDTDLSPHISDIADVMTKQQITSFVRKQGMSHTVIDQITQDHLNNCAELKISLLQTWYEEKGREGAYESLILTLRKLHFRSAAGKIEQIVEPPIQNIL